MTKADWRSDLEDRLSPYLSEMGHKKRRMWAPVYLQGLIGPGERKSLQPTAARLGLGSHDQLHHFVTSTTWNDAALRRVPPGPPGSGSCG